MEEVLAINLQLRFGSPLATLVGESHPKEKLSVDAVARLFSTDAERLSVHTTGSAQHEIIVHESSDDESTASTISAHA